MDDRTDEQQAELEKLTGEVQKLEPEMRAAIAAEPDPQVRTTATENVDAETRERLELRGRARIGNFFHAALRGRVLDGVEAEYCAAALGSTLRGGYVDVPLDLFEANRPREVRADAPSPAPTTVGVMHQPVQPFLFAPSIASTLGIEMPTVSSGTFAASTITTSLTAGAKAKGGAAESTAAELTVVTSTVKRISGRLSLQAEDVAAVGVPAFENALRENLSMVMSDKFDDAAINGSGSGNDLTGLIKRLTDPTNPTAVVDWDAFNAAFADAIDGLWATTCTDVAILAGVDTYKKSVKTFRDSAGENPNDLGDVSAAAYLMKHTGGWRTNKRMPAAASNIQDRDRVPEGPHGAHGTAPDLGPTHHRRHLHRLRKGDAPLHGAHPLRRRGGGTAGGLRPSRVHAGVGRLMLEVIVGAPFAGKDRWVAAEIERRESAGELGLLALSFTGIFSAIVPGAESVYRDEEVSDSGTPRLVAYLLATATAEAGRRELNGYVALDSPRRALQVLEQIGGNRLVEVTVSEQTAHRRAEQHIEIVRDLAPRAGADDAKAAAARCRKMVAAYFRERDVLDNVDVRQVRAPDRPSDQAIQYSWRAAIRAAKRGDTAGRDKWKAAATRMLAVRGVRA